MDKLEQVTLLLLKTFCILIIATWSQPSLANTIIADNNTSIQEAINQVDEGGTVQVAPMVFTEANILINKSVTIQGDEGRAADTIVQAQATYPADASTAATRVFQINSGKTVTIKNLTIQYGNHPSSGGGIQNSGNLTLQNCIVKENRVQTSVECWGGGIYSSGPLRLENCIVSKNKAQTGCWTNSHAGGGAVCMWDAANAVLVNCELAENECYSWGGGYNTWSQGGAVLSHAYMTVTAVNCKFLNNQATGQTGSMSGAIGGPGAQILTNCLFDSNRVNSSGSGGAIQDNSADKITNCFFINNYPVAIEGSATVKNSIFAIDPETPIGQIRNGGSNFTYSCIEDGSVSEYPGAGNIFESPQLIDIVNGNYHLSNASPCIDAGDNTAVPPDTSDLDGDSNVSEPTPLDLDKEDRFIDTIEIPDTGNGIPPIVDMGVYEFGGTCGNNIKEGTEECDGTDDDACPALCQGNCTCPDIPVLSYEIDVEADATFETGNTVNLYNQSNVLIDFYIDTYACSPDDKLFGIQTYISIDESLVQVNNCYAFDESKGGPFDSSLSGCVSPTNNVHFLVASGFDFISVSGGQQKFGTMEVSCVDEGVAHLVVADDQTTYGYSYTDGYISDCNTVQGHPTDAVVTIEQFPVCQCSVTPDPAAVLSGNTLQFTANPGQYCTNPPAYSWSDTCSAGNIDQSGLLTTQVIPGIENCQVCATDTANIGVGGSDPMYCAAVTIDRDSDSDGAPDSGDNCQDRSNGPLLGTCVKPVSGVIVDMRTTCTNDGACATGETCDMSQGDINSNGIGDACECYADSNCDEKVDLSDLVIMKNEFLVSCPPSPCSSDFNGDGQVDLGDLVITKMQFLRLDCPACP